MTWQLLYFHRLPCRKDAHPGNNYCNLAPAWMRNFVVSKLFAILKHLPRLLSERNGISTMHMRVAVTARLRSNTPLMIVPRTLRHEDVSRGLSKYYTLVFISIYATHRFNAVVLLQSRQCKFSYFLLTNHRMRSCNNFFCD